MPTAKVAWVDFKEIKEKVSIVQILERYGVLDTLSKSGGDRLSGACPIHGGTNKTHFRVSISKNCWNCFGKCQCGGNIIDFVSKKEGVPFRDAALIIQEWFLGEQSESQSKPERPHLATSQVEEKPRFRVPESPDNSDAKGSRRRDSEQAARIRACEARQSAPVFAGARVDGGDYCNLRCRVLWQGPFARVHCHSDPQFQTVSLSPTPDVGREFPRMEMANTNCPRDSRKVRSFSIITAP